MKKKGWDSILLSVGPLSKKPMNPGWDRVFKLSIHIFVEIESTFVSCGVLDLELLSKRDLRIGGPTRNIIVRLGNKTLTVDSHG